MIKIDLNSIHKILIIQYEPFGDVLLNTGYFPFLREKFPRAKIDFLVCKPYCNVLQNNPYINELVIFEKKQGLKYLIERIKLFFRIHKKKYDLIIDQIRGTGSASMTLFSGAKYRIGNGRKRLSFIYNVKVNKITRRYSAGMKFDLLKPLGIEEKPYQLYYYIKPESEKYIESWLKKNELVGKRLICFSPGSPVLRKKWNLNNYAKLADLILEKTDRLIVLLWGPGEKEDIKIIKRMMQHKAIIALPTDFNQAAAMLKKSELLICNDGGINHLSVAVGTPSLAIFGSTNPVKWGAENMSGHYYLHNPEVNSREDDTFGITPEMVFSKTLEIIS